MDTPSSRNGSYLVFAAGIVAVVALILGITGLVKVSRVAKQVGNVSVSDLAVRVDTAEASAKKASADAERATTRVTGLNTDTQRAFDAVRDEIVNMRNTVTRLTTDTKAVTDRLAEMDTRGAARAASGGGAAAGTAGPAPGTLAADGTYVIKAGDTFGKLASQFGVSVDEIVRANPGVDPRRLRIGQKVVVPTRQ